MNTDSNEFAAAEAALAAGYGKAAWGTALGVGSFLTVEFGAEQPAPEPQRRPHGEFHLWVYCSAWRIEDATQIVASSEDPREQLQTAVSHLDGRTLTRIDIQRPSLSTDFVFHDGTLLRTFSIFTKEYEHWMFHLPSGDVFTAGPGSTWSLGRD